MTEPAVRGIWRRREAALAFMCSFADPFSAELVAEAGFDVVIIDAQHGLGGRDAAVRALQVISRMDVTALVRVPSHDAASIGAVLDAGAAGVIVPAVESAAQAADAVAACRYAPHGVRSMGPNRGALVRGGALHDATEEAVCIAMVETAQGFRAIEQIVRCPGLDGVLAGPVDLALSLGVPPLRGDPPIEAALDRILEVCLEHDVVAAIGASPNEARGLIERGYRMISVGSDVLALRTAAEAALRSARGV